MPDQQNTTHAASSRRPTCRPTGRTCLDTTRTASSECTSFCISRRSVLADSRWALGRRRREAVADDMRALHASLDRGTCCGRRARRAKQGRPTMRGALYKPYTLTPQGRLRHVRHRRHRLFHVLPRHPAAPPDARVQLQDPLLPGRPALPGHLFRVQDVVPQHSRQRSR